METNAPHLGVKIVLSEKGRLIAYFNKALKPKHQTFLVHGKYMLFVLLVIKK